MELLYHTVKMSMYISVYKNLQFVGVVGAVRSRSYLYNSNSQKKVSEKKCRRETENKNYKILLFCNL